MVFTCQLAPRVVDVEPDEGVVLDVVDTGPGWVVDDGDEVVLGRVVDTPVVLVVTGAAMGVNGPGLTCSPAAATICQARRVVSAVAVTQTAMRPRRFTRLILPVVVYLAGQRIIKVPSRGMPTRAPTDSLPSWPESPSSKTTWRFVVS